ncbi:MAG: ABC transporter substrate-binding protein [Thiotrichaceae bacterium]
MKTWIWSNLLVVLVSLSFVPAAIALQTDPDGIIDDASKQLLVTLKQESARFNSNPQGLYNKIRTQMRPITDIAAIAKGIMGSYYKVATASQQQRFKVAFEQSLVKVYSDSLMKVRVKGFKVRAAPALSSNARKRKVVVEVSTHKGNTFLVSYSLLRNRQNKWLIRNIVADGVNFGLTYRNQFKSEMARSGNNMDQVIDNWAKVIKK